MKPRDSESNPGLSKSSVVNVNDIDTIYLSEMFLDSSILVDDNRLTIIFYSIMAVKTKWVENVYTIKSTYP